jgi:hypothetical protein
MYVEPVQVVRVAGFVGLVVLVGLYATFATFAAFALSGHVRRTFLPFFTRTTFIRLVLFGGTLK